MYEERAYKPVIVVFIVIIHKVLCNKMFFLLCETRFENFLAFCKCEQNGTVRGLYLLEKSNTTCFVLRSPFYIWIY